MSLFDQISNSLSLTSIVGGGVDSALGGLRDAAKGNPFAEAVVNSGIGAAKSTALSTINRSIPPGYGRVVTAGVGAIGDIANGNLAGAGLRIFDSGILDQFLSGASGIGAQARYFNSPTPLMGGITPRQAMEISKEVLSTAYSYKNFFVLEVSSALTGENERFNFFAVDVDYAPYTISGEKYRIGSGHVDTVNSGDPVEMRITAFDDTQGTMKAWFKAHAGAAVNGDGTVGLQSQYAIKIKVVHSVTKGAILPGYEEIGLFRAANIEHSLSRRDPALEEIQLTFTQMDTFIQHSVVN